MHNLVDGFHDGGPELLLVFHSTDSLMQLRIITMHAIVHNTIQVEVQIVCIEITKNLLVHILSSVSWSVYQISFSLVLTDRHKVFLFFDLLEDQRVASCEPSEEFRDSHC